MELKPISGSGCAKIIDDDDLCSDCKHCEYRPGELSGCKLAWPGQEDADGYVKECVNFDKISSQEENATWDAFANSGMRHLEESDISGGETDQ